MREQNNENMGKLKCSCCENDNLEVRAIGGVHQFYAFRLGMDVNKVENVNKARVCMACGNIMPFVDSKLLRNSLETE